jgi:hypothetical protein
MLRQTQILPGMRIGHPAWPDGMIMPSPSAAMVMPVMRMGIHHAGRDAIRGGHQGALEARGPDHAIKPAFKAKPIADDDPGIGKQGGIRWLGLKPMRILIRPGNGAERDAIPADLARHIRKDGEGGDDRGPLLGAGGPSEQKGGGEEDGTAQHGREPSGSN